MSLLELPKIIEKSNDNLKWFINNQERLIDQFPNEFVAIDDEHFIDHDKSMERLVDELKRSKRYTNSTLIQFVHDRKTKLMF